MLIEDTTLYEKKHFIHIYNMRRDIFYYFDYDERNHSENMEFQHFHSFFEMMIPLCDEADHLIEGNLYHIRLNDIVLLAPTVLHKSSYLKGKPSKRIIIQFMFPDQKFGIPELYKELLQIFYNNPPIFRFNPEDTRKLFGILNEIFLFSRKPDFTGTTTDNFYIHTKFQEFLYTLFSMKDRNIYKNETVNNAIERKMYSIASYIHTHYQQELSLESLAEHFYISPGYLSHQFKIVTGFTIVQYIQMTRIKNVQSRLISTDEKITDVALSCGFSSFSQFNRIFKKITGISPSDYRKSQKDIG